MYWYFIYDPLHCYPQFIQLLNDQQDIKAFIPKIERWYKTKEIKKYVEKELYSHYILAQTSLNQEKFCEKYNEFYHQMLGYQELKDDYHIYSLSKEDQWLLEKLFGDLTVIRHSIGRIIHSRLTVDQGPLKGLENYIVKIDRHHRVAMLENTFTSQLLKVPLEVVSKS